MLFEGEKIKKDPIYYSFIGENISISNSKQLKDKVAYFKLSNKVKNELFHHRVILEIGDTVPKDALMIICDKTYFCQDDNPIKAITLIRTNGDFTQTEKINEVWIALFDFQNLKIVHIDDVKILGEIKASQKTV